MLDGMLSMQGFTPESFRQMCILSGCDYLSSVPGVGLGKASKLMRKFNHNPYKVCTLVCKGFSLVPDNSWFDVVGD